MALGSKGLLISALDVTRYAETSRRCSIAGLTFLVNRAARNRFNALD